MQTVRELIKRKLIFLFRSLSRSCSMDPTMSAKALYKRYKKRSSGLFNPVTPPENPGPEHISALLRVYAKFDSCADLRQAYRDKYVEVDRRDEGHETAIAAAQQRAAECESILKLLFERKDENPLPCPVRSSSPPPNPHPPPRPVPSPQPNPPTLSPPSSETSTLAQRRVALLNLLNPLKRDFYPAFFRSDDYHLTTSRVQDILDLLRVTVRKVEKSCTAFRLSFDEVTQLDMACDILITVLSGDLEKRGSGIYNHFGLTGEGCFPAQFLLKLGFGIIRQDPGSGDFLRNIHHVVCSLCSLLCPGFETQVDEFDAYVMHREVMTLLLDSMVYQLPSLFTEFVREYDEKVVLGNGSIEDLRNSTPYRPGLYSLDHRLLSISL
jgi:hypothetical protein